MSDETTTITEEPTPVAVSETGAVDTNDAAVPAGEATDAAEAPETVGPPKAGDIVTGTVVRLVDFAAFVDIPINDAGATVTGLVHVSEVDAGFVENIYAHLSVGDATQVKVLSIGDDGKVGLSIKQADPDYVDRGGDNRPRRSTIDKDFDRKLRKFMHGSQSIQGEVRRQRRSRLGIQKR